MNLEEFKHHIESIEEGVSFNYGISEPFSWRGSYDEVAFEIVEQPMSREEILENIQKAFTETFYGYKGGQYTYCENTPVNFEEDTFKWSDGGYCSKIIAKIEGNKPYKSQEFRLANIAFPSSI